jgi:hypothetical protein
MGLYNWSPWYCICRLVLESFLCKPVNWTSCISCLLLSLDTWKSNLINKLCWTPIPYSLKKNSVRNLLILIFGRLWWGQRGDRQWITWSFWMRVGNLSSYFLMLIICMTIRLVAPLQESLFLLGAPWSCGLVSIKAVLQHWLTQLSFSQCGPP